MTDDDFPFVQRRFFEEYAAWTAVECILDTSRLIEAVPEVKRLVARPMDGPELVLPQEALIRAQPRATPVFEPLTPAQIRDRREMLRQQVIVAAARFGKPADGVPETCSSVADASRCD